MLQTHQLPNVEVPVAWGKGREGKVMRDSCVRINVGDPAWHPSHDQFPSQAILFHLIVLLLYS